MSEYAYVKLDYWKKTWHLTLNDWITVCGEGQEKDARGRGRWGDRSESPRGPLCKRCIKCREARER